METTIESLEAFEATLSPVVQPIGSYVTAVQTGNLVYTSGALPMKDGILQHYGDVGSFLMTVEEGQAAARLCCMNLLSVLKDKLGTLSRVEQVVKLTGYVNSAPCFTEQAKVVNGASDLLAEVFGERGRHARTSIGVSALPLDASVELDLIVQVAN
jgi:enamine deaminase RidA (YjgF/YER057c/UK114 family)